MAEVLTEKQLADLQEQIGAQATKEIGKQMEAYKEKFESLKGVATKEEMEGLKTQTEETIETIKEIARKQGSSLAELKDLMEGGKTSERKSVAECLAAAKKEISDVTFDPQKRSTIEFMLNVDKDGKYYMKRFERKAVGVHATVAGVDTDVLASVTADSSVDAAAIMRMASNAEIMDRYRDSGLVYGLVDVRSGSGVGSTYQYWEEQAVQGGSATVAEGQPKPLVQYSYELQTKPYKKEAVFLNMTEEFMMDFPRLQSEIESKVQLDLRKNLSDKVVANIIANATLYNTGTQYKLATDGGPLAPNDWDAINAMAAQVEAQTFTQYVNAALVSTYKGRGMGMMRELVTGDGGWLNRPEILQAMNIIRTSQMTGDNVVVGDLKQYILALRGGLIVRFGHNGEDFRENRLSAVVEQYYFDFIPDSRKAAIVKGETFATVKTAIKHA